MYMYIQKLHFTVEDVVIAIKDQTVKKFPHFKKPGHPLVHTTKYTFLGLRVAVTIYLAILVLHISEEYETVMRALFYGFIVR